MKWTITNLRPPTAPGRTFALCAAALAARLTIRGVRVVDGPTGRFVSMPSRKVGDEFEEVVSLAPDLLAQLKADVAEAIASWKPVGLPTQPADLLDDLPF